MKLFNVKYIAAIVLCLAMVLGAVSCGGVDIVVQFIVDGEVYATIHTSGSEMITLPDNPEKEGYRFVGWYWDEDTWKEPFTANSLMDAPLASSMSIYARFKPLGTTDGTDDAGTDTTGGDNTETGGDNGTQNPTPIGEAPIAGQAYHIVMEQGNVGKTFYLTGTLDGYYLGTTEDITVAPNFYFEKAESSGGQEQFRLYGIVKGVKTYINLYKNGTHTNFKLEAEPDATVYYYDASINALVVVCEGELMVLGTAKDKNYTNVAPCMYAEAESSFVVKYVKSTQEDQGADSTPPVIYNTADEILDAAAALGNNEYLSDRYAYTLSGIILSVVTEWSEEYGNISVSILVDGTAARMIECYRLSGEGAETLKIGDKITVTGPITRYVKIDENTGEILIDKVEFNYPKLDRLESDFVPDTPDEILNAAEALGSNEYLMNRYPFILSGEIVEIITPWTEEFENIRVLITVDGTEGRTIECFRLSGEGTESLALGDKITVGGPIMRYVNVDEDGVVIADKIEFYYPILISIDSDNGGGTEIYRTPAEIMENAKLLAPGTYLSDGYGYTLSGKIQSVDVEFNADFGNISVTVLVDGTADTIQAFRMIGDVTVLPLLEIGDSITVTGPILMYQNPTTGALKLEFEKPELEAYTKGEGSTAVTPEIEALIPAVGTPYLFTLRQINVGKIMYFSGVMDTYYLGTTEDKSAAANVYIEAADDGYYLYCIQDGQKLYINLVLNGTHVNPALESAPATVYTYDETLGTLTTPFNGGTWLFGTSASGTYLNAAARDASMENIVMQFTASAKVDPAPEKPKELTIAEFVNIALAQPNRGEATVEKYIIKGVITEIENIIYGNMTIEDDSGSVFVYSVYDADGKNLFEHMTVQPKAGDTVVLLGVAGNYDRAQMQNAWIQEIIPGEATEDDSVIYETAEEIVNAAYALGANRYLSKGIDYTLTGEIVQIDTPYNETYGNITVTIVANGMTDKPIMCYRLSGDSVDSLKIGDLITVTGPIKNYVKTDAETGEVTQQTVEFDKPVLDRILNGDNSENGDAPLDGVHTLDLTAQGFANGSAITSVEADDFTVIFDKGTNSNMPKYYTAGDAVRLYSRGTMTVAAADGYTIKSITITFGAGGYDNEITVNVGTLTDNVWLGDASSVVFTVGGTSGHRRFVIIAVELESIA